MTDKKHTHLKMLTPEELFELYNPEEPIFRFCKCGCERYRHNQNDRECLFCKKCVKFIERQMHEYPTPIKELFYLTSKSKFKEECCIHCATNSRIDRRLNLYGWIFPPGGQTLYCDEEI